MTTITEYTGGAHNATSYTGSGAGLYGVPRGGISSGSSNHVVINDDNGVLSSEIHLSTARGGIGKDSSSWNGLVNIASGVWTPGYKITDADISSDTFLSRSKIAPSDDKGYFLKNDNTTGAIVGVQFIPLTNGGTGADLSSANGILVVNSGSTSANLQYASTNSALALVQRDINGNFSANVITSNGLSTSSIGSSSDLVLTAGSGQLKFGSSICNLSAGTNSNVYIRTSKVTTTDTTATNLLNFQTTNGVYHVKAEIVCLNSSASSKASGTYSFACKISNVGGTLTVSPKVNKVTILDSGLSTTDCSVSSDSNNVNIVVTGISSTVDWTGYFTIVQQGY